MIKNVHSRTNCNSARLIEKKESEVKKGDKNEPGYQLRLFPICEFTPVLCMHG